jgi:hypothetical protein
MHLPTLSRLLLPPNARFGDFIREGHREACSMGGCDQFVGVGAFSIGVASRKVLAL